MVLKPSVPASEEPEAMASMVSVVMASKLVALEPMHSHEPVQIHSLYTLSPLPFGSGTRYIFPFSPSKLGSRR